MLWNGMNHSSYSSLDHFPNLRPRGNCDKASPSPQQKTVPKQHVGPWFLTPDGTFKLGFGAPSANKTADIGLPVSHGGVKIKVQLAQRTENLAKQAAAEDESHPPSQGHRHMGPCSDLLFCSAITQLNYTSLLSCSHDDWILEPTEIISWTFVALAHERNLGLLQNLSSMTRQGLLETSTPKCSWTGGRAM